MLRLKQFGAIACSKPPPVLRLRYFYSLNLPSLSYKRHTATRSAMSASASAKDDSSSASCSVGEGYRGRGLSFVAMSARPKRKRENKVDKESTERRERRCGTNQPRVDRTRICFRQRAATSFDPMNTAQHEQHILFHASAYEPTYTQTCVQTYVCA